MDVETGEKVEYQLSRIANASDPRPWAAERVAMARFREKFNQEIVFMAEGLPAMGYRSYRVVPKDTLRPTPADVPLETGDLENRFFRLTVDAGTGTMTGLFDKELGRELIDTAAPHGFGDLIVRSCATAEEQAWKVTGIGIAEHGTVFTTLRLEGSSFAVPRWTRDIIVYHQEKRIDVNFRLLRDSEPNVELFAAFPFRIADPTVMFEGSGSVIEPTVDQIPGSNTDYYAMQHWADVAGNDYGISWCPIDTHMAEFGGLWPGYVSRAHHGVTGPDYGHPFLKPGEIGNGHIYAMIMYSNFRTNFINVQPGEILCRYSFRPHKGDWREGDATGFGWGVMNPAFGVWMRGPNKGALPPVRSFCSVTPSNVLILNIKRADDGKGFIVRLAEIEGRTTQARLDVSFIRFSRAAAANPVEEDREAIPCSDGLVSVPMGPFETKTVRLIEQSDDSKDS
jgi:alpha-mannosidase